MGDLIIGGGILESCVGLIVGWRDTGDFVCDGSIRVARESSFPFGAYFNKKNYTANQFKQTRKVVKRIC